MANQYANKVVNGETGEVIIDLTGDTLINASQLQSGIKAHARSGATITGTNTNDADTSDANATASQILDGATAYVQGNKVTGTYSGETADLQAKTVTPKFSAQTVTADAGYDALSQVTVNAIPYSETDNAQGGRTVTIG